MTSKKLPLPNPDTIAAIATPPGFGGIGIIRISGPLTKEIAAALCPPTLPKPRFAHYATFKNQEGKIIDQGLALYFPAPNSFTGEDVLELHGHGGPVVMDLLLKRVIELGARQARPGEFSERAFLNGKIDLVEAEAIADLINASSSKAAHSAINSLRGKFSEAIYALREKLILLRMQIEANIDFPEEELNLAEQKTLPKKLAEIIKNLEKIKANANTGVLLREGVNIVIIGAPNVGKSSLLNLFTGEETAIVTPIAGTTRDILSATIY